MGRRGGAEEGEDGEVAQEVGVGASPVLCAQGAGSMREARKPLRRLKEANKPSAPVAAGASATPSRAARGGGAAGGRNGGRKQVTPPPHDDLTCAGLFPGADDVDCFLVRMMLTESIGVVQEVPGSGGGCTGGWSSWLGDHF